MRKILLLFILLLSIGVKGQETMNINEIDGFGDFIIGDPYSKWSSDLTFAFSLEDGKLVYDYTGNRFKTFYGYPIHAVKLTFKNNRLRSIILANFSPLKDKDSPLAEPNKFNSRIRLTLGEDFRVSKSRSGENIFRWYGEKVVVISSYSYLENSKEEMFSITFSDPKP